MRVLRFACLSAISIDFCHSNHPSVPLTNALLPGKDNSAFVPHYRHLRSRVLQISQQRCGCISLSTLPRNYSRQKAKRYNIVILETVERAFPKRVINSDRFILCSPSFFRTLHFICKYGGSCFTWKKALIESQSTGMLQEYIHVWLYEEEYVPPKVEVVENEEADAVFSTRCSVFKLVDKQYSKVGIGMLHLKEVDGKKSVLVRAATAIGTVWINALMNKAMKVSKVDEKGEKIRLTYPASEEEISTYIIRFPSAKEASRIVEDIEAAAK
ncbi:unnamed protein product [Angiostrongylus costaricensis]|uniref:RanBD1 domain-containing protein n=1 Tax=Angiostrongylus costaricensis TaxID=334426 RepID=A0A0R3PAR3_ANGCS|nr:unnamed protein product [Angiostrongylus costaricensis]